MKTRMMKWLAAMLIVSMMAALLPAALTEAWDIDDGAVSSNVEEEAAVEAEFALGGDDESGESENITANEENAVRGEYVYALTDGETAIYRDADMTDALCRLPAGSAVLVTGREGRAAVVSVNSEDGVITGYAPAANLSEMTPAEAGALQDALVSNGDPAVYDNDVDWLLADVRANASDFTKLSNDTEYVVQGKTIKASMVGDYSDCWSWARALYNIIWGTKFTSDWEGTDETGRNLIRNLSDEERKLTGDNLKKFIEQAELGCTLRICSCPSDCPNFSKDGCSKHEKHSLIVVAKDNDGMVVMDNMTGSGSDRYSTRYYTYDNFASHWAKYEMIKYIKWPYAAEYVKEGYGEPVITPTGVTLSQSGTVTLGLGCTLQLNATLEPEGAKADLTWQSANPSVATISADGVVTPVAKGSCAVGVITDNGLYDSVTISVVAPSKLKLEKSSVTLGVGESLTVRHAVTPEGACQDVEWASSNEKVATVENGVITGVEEGSATIAARTLVGGKTAKVKVKVVNPNKVTKIALDRSGTVSMSAGETLTLTAKLTPANAVTTLTWGSTDEKVAMVKDGVVLAVGGGSCTVGVATANGKKAKVKIKVSGEASGQSGTSTTAKPAKKIKLSKSGTAKLKVGDKLTVTAKMSPSDATSKIAWASSDEKVAKVKNGVVLAVGEGSCTVGAVTDNGKKASFKVKVSGGESTNTTGGQTADASDAADAEVEAIALSKSGTVKLNAGDKITVEYKLSPANAATTLTWGSSDEKVAKVKDGVVLAVGEGTCTVGAMTANGKKASFKVQVAEKESNKDSEKESEKAESSGEIEVTAVKLNKSGTIEMKKGDKLSLSVAFKPANATTDYAWKSTDSSVASVSSSGTVKAKKAGTATVGVLTANNKYATVKIKVVE